jgi:2-dehydro-3-deoxygluconokinase
MVKEAPLPGTSRVWYYRAGSAGSRLRPDDLPPELVAGAAVLHLTGITAGLSPDALATIRHALELASDAVVSFDVNHRPPVWAGRDAAVVYRELARSADVVFAGEDEARLLTGSSTTDPAGLLEELAAATGGDAVLKRGAEGCLARVDGATYEVPAEPVDVVDTVGAGDAFVAGYLAELLVGADAQQRLSTATRCGAFTCRSPGDWEGLPTRRDLDAFDRADPVVR